jgi:streptogramin lyase
MRLRPLAAAGALTAALVLAAPAAAFIVQPVATQSPTRGITLGPDGNLWAAEPDSGTVARITPTGTVLDHLPVGGRPEALASGPGGRVWVTVTNARKLVWIDATSAAPTTHDVSTGAPGSCGPVAIADGGDGRMFFSLPVIGGCAGIETLGSVPADPVTGPTPVPVLGAHVLDLVSSGGKLFAPDFAGDRVVRVSQGINPLPEASITAPAGSGPIGVAPDAAGNIWFTENVTGRIGRFLGTAANASAAEELTPTGGMLSGPTGIVAGADGGMYVAGTTSQNIVRIAADGTFRFFSAAGSQPFDIVSGPDEDLWFTDLANARVLRFVNSAPRTTTNSATLSSATTAELLGTVNPRGNDTTIVFDYGTTTAYGASTGAVVAPAGAAPVQVGGTLAALAPATTYHVRARATNAEGTTAGADVAFTTPAAAGGTPPGPGTGTTPAVPKLAATTSFGFTRTTSLLTLRRIDLKKLAGGETATIRCSGSTRCALKVKTYRNLKKGTRTFGRTLLKGRRLSVGTIVSVRVTKAGSIGTVTSLKVRRARAPQITRRCLPPGATTPKTCG